MSPRYSWSKRVGFTLVEMMIVLGIIGVLTSLIVGFAMKVRKGSQDMVCLHNLRQISTGLLMFHQEHGDIPLAEPPLSETLAPYLKEPGIFMCPASRYPTADSYSKFYVRRTSRAAS
jgi:prepilin-type N-terminal cleavage/methylation domain-containing protein